MPTFTPRADETQVLLFSSESSRLIIVWLKNLWSKWWQISGYAVTFQGRVLLSLIYFTLLAPIGATFRLLKYNPLNTNPTYGATYWEERTPQENPPTLTDLTRQY